MLLHKHFTLVDPSAWDDKNDSYCLRLYQQRRKDIASVRVACLTERDETYHHWRIFANGPAGICQVFNRENLLEFVDAQPDLRGDKVTYIANAKLARLTSLVDDSVPFLKRLPYGDEGEYRVVYESILPTGKVHNVQMSPEQLTSVLNRIVVSPWTPEPIYLSLKEIIRSIDGCERVRVTRSLCTDTPAFKRALDGHFPDLPDMNSQGESTTLA
jgi:hypothetical protein